MMWPRRATGLGRLRRDRDVRRVLTEAGRWQDGLLILRAMQAADEPTLALAVAVGRKFGRPAARNRIKRWIKESTRQILRGQDTRGGWWLVIIARSGAIACDHRQVHASLERLLGEAGIGERKCDGVTA